VCLGWPRWIGEARAWGEACVVELSVVGSLHLYCDKELCV